jgi:hypothetical protein
MIWFISYILCGVFGGWRLAERHLQPHEQINSFGFIWIVGGYFTLLVLLIDVMNDRL